MGLLTRMMGFRGRTYALKRGVCASAFTRAAGISGVDSHTVAGTPRSRVKSAPDPAPLCRAEDKAGRDLSDNLAIAGDCLKSAEIGHF